VLARAGGVQEHAGALDDQVDVHLLPGQRGRVAAGNDLDGLAVDRQGAVVDDLHVGVKLAEGGVVLEQVAGLLHAARVVDGHHVEQAVLAALPAAQEVAADAAEAVDGHADLLLRAHIDDGLQELDSRARRGWAVPGCAARGEPLSRGP
jgi:hypothetical protein